MDPFLTSSSHLFVQHVPRLLPSAVPSALPSVPIRGASVVHVAILWTQLLLQQGLLLLPQLRISQILARRRVRPPRIVGTHRCVAPRRHGLAWARHRSVGVPVIASRRLRRRRRLGRSSDGAILWLHWRLHGPMRRIVAEVHGFSRIMTWRSCP